MPQKEDNLDEVKKQHQKYGTTDMQDFVGDLNKTFPKTKTEIGAELVNGAPIFGKTIINGKEIFKNGKVKDKVGNSTFYVAADEDGNPVKWKDIVGEEELQRTLSSDKKTKIWISKIIGDQFKETDNIDESKKKLEVDVFNLKPKNKKKETKKKLSTNEIDFYAEMIMKNKLKNNDKPKVNKLKKRR